MSAKSTVLEPADSLQLLGALINDHRAALKRPVSIGFAVEGFGTWVLDTRSNDIVSPGWREGLDVQILCNREALSAFVLGRLDLEKPPRGHNFMCGGDLGVFGALRDAFSGAKSWLAVRAGP
jgi:hypothetical protein